MDPNETLRLIRELFQQYWTGGEFEDNETERFVLLVEALDDWLSKGGFPPALWRQKDNDPFWPPNES